MSKTKTCPACGASSTGNFCSSCGASLGGRHCTQCGAGLESGARFCNECGAPVGAAVPSPPATGAQTGDAPRAAPGGRARAATSAPARVGAQASAESSGGGNMGWWAAGAMMVLLVMILALPILRPEEPAAPAGVGAGAGAPAVTDISNMSPGEAASRLYNRVMQAASNDDTAQVQMFLPMAIDAHELAKPLSADEAFHLSSLQRMALRNEEALASAEEALALEPNHLLLLYTAGEAARAAGQTDLANQFANKLLEVWDEETVLAREEYAMHQGMMQDIRAFVESGGGG